MDSNFCFQPFQEPNVHVCLFVDSTESVIYSLSENITDAWIQTSNVTPQNAPVLEKFHKYRGNKKKNPPKPTNKTPMKPETALFYYCLWFLLVSKSTLKIT